MRRGVPPPAEADLFLRPNCQISQTDIVVKKGEAVIWYNQDKKDRIIETNDFSLYINPGHSAVHYFEKLGVYKYNYCGEDSEKSFGQITVE